MRASLKEQKEDVDAANLANARALVARVVVVIRISISCDFRFVARY